MRHFTLLLMAAAALCAPSSAQNKVRNIYTSSPSLNLEALRQSEARPVSVCRTLFAGYNSICLPMSLSAEQLRAAAKGVQVERLARVAQDGAALELCFLDCTAQGLEAGVPYLIYSPSFQVLRARSDESGGVSTDLRSVTMSDGQGNRVTFGSSWESVRQAGRYGIPAKQDTYTLESVLVETDTTKVFLPTRCGFTWESKSPTATELRIKHVTTLADTGTSIERLQREGVVVGVYDTRGTLVKNATVDEALHTLPRGIYVVNGQKIAVK